MGQNRLRPFTQVIPPTFSVKSRRLYVTKAIATPFPVFIVMQSARHPATVVCLVLFKPIFAFVFPIEVFIKIVETS